MHYIAAAFILAGSAGVMATPDDAPGSNQYIELLREPANAHNGTLVYYGMPDEPSPTIEQRAKASCVPYTNGTMACDSSHNEARNENCEKLIDELYTDSGTEVPTTPRQICYQGDGQKDAYCCISWSTSVPSLIKGDLAPFAASIASNCTSNGISGKITNAQLFQTCSNISLSSRGTHCS